MTILPVALFVAFLAGESSPDKESEVIVDVMRPLKCQPSIQVIKSCLEGNAQFHLEMQRGAKQIKASLMSVTPKVFSSWAECVATKWNEIFPQTQVLPEGPRNVAVHFSTIGACTAPKAAP